MPQFIPVEHDPFTDARVGSLSPREEPLRAGPPAPVQMVPDWREYIEPPPRGFVPPGMRDPIDPEPAPELLEELRRAGRLIPVEHDPFADDQVQVAPQDWRLPDLAALTGMPSALEQSAAAMAENPYRQGMTAGQVLAGRPEDPLASSFGVGAIKAGSGRGFSFVRENPNAVPGPTSEYRIHNDVGDLIGWLGVTLEDSGKTAYVNRIYQTQGEPLGISGIRELARSFLVQHPDVERIGGDRVTGARPASEEVFVSRHQLIPVDHDPFDEVPQ
jgi:hypothetical protein